MAQDPEEIVLSTLEDLDRYYSTNQDGVEDEEGSEALSDGQSDGSEQLGAGDSQEDSQGKTTPEGTDGLQQEGEQPPGQAEGSQSVTFPDGSTRTVDELYRIAQFEQYLEANPDVAARVVEAAKGVTSSPVEPPPTQAATTVPDYIDLEDPVVKYLVEQNQVVASQLEELRRQQSQRELAQAQSQLDVAMSNIKDRFSLSDEDLNKLRTRTAELNVLPAFMARNQESPVLGFEQAMEFTLWSDSTFRDQQTTAQLNKLQSEQQETRTRTNKLNKVATSSGGTPPTNRKEPKTDEERREAMIQEISEAMAN
jgi:hypothetical protein